MIREPEDYAVEYTLRALRGITFKSLQLVLRQLSGQNRTGGMVTEKQMAKATQARDFIDFDKRLLDSRLNEHIFKQELKRFGVQANIMEMANGNTKLQFFSKDKEALIHALENITDRIYSRQPDLINKLYPDYEKNNQLNKEVEPMIESTTQKNEQSVTKENQSFVKKVTQESEKNKNPIKMEIEKAKIQLAKEQAENKNKERKGPNREEHARS